MIEHGVGIGVHVRIRSAVLFETWFRKDGFHFHVVNDGRVSPRALSESALFAPNARIAHAPRKLRGTVRQELDLGKPIGTKGLVLFETMCIIVVEK